MRNNIVDGNNIMYKKILNLIKKYDKIVIYRHKNPDGDALGSQIGLYELIKENYPEKTVYKVGDEAGRYSFMPGSVMDSITNETLTDALAIVLDSAEKSLVSDDTFALAAKTVRFDHHIFCNKFCDEECVSQTFESCAGLIADFAEKSKLKINTAAANALFTGIVTDSGRFRYDSSSADTLRRAAFLIDNGAVPCNIYKNLYSEEYEILKLRASFVLKIQFTSNRVAYLYNTLEEVKQLGVSDFTVSRGMVNVMADIKGVDIWVNFTESANGVLCELRSSKYNINKIAVRYGGGGHEKASGATLNNKDEALKMLEELNEMVAENE